jgi:hypothetical protein
MKLKVGITGSTGVLGKIICAHMSSNNILYSCFRGDIQSKKMCIIGWLRMTLTLLFI